MSKVKILSVLLAGAAAGAILGVLLAPDKGTNTRKKISKKAEDLIDQLSKKMEEGKTVLSDLKDKAMDLAGEAKSKGTTATHRHSSN